MGLLDDAIREHLELKRKHGANPEDVLREEKEALGQGGPRAEFAQPDAEPEDRQAAPPPAPEPEPEPVDELPEGEPGIREEPSEGHVAEAPGYDEDPWLDEEPDEVPAGESLERPQGQPAGEEDVLEETPDFLQETPEHDRLWFEQKPPRDFDWDK
ncbi:hypothetical protein [Candidatus Solirubrobacter pratensis]|uniref:hypothetical protein n=1 Tax=Candidatus Solirubrobacter pratensis TaxID=1298857 RepID=UPI00042223C6|nr:hypothetical protein [Candidatus Solirubrobacter pratensis]